MVPKEAEADQEYKDLLNETNTIIRDYRKSLKAQVLKCINIKYKLLKLCVGTKFYMLIKSMYSNSKSCIKIKKNQHTDFFQIKLGVKQGDNLSPNLFNIFINDLPEYLKGKDKKEIEADDAEVETSEEK